MSIKSEYFLASVIAAVVVGATLAHLAGAEEETFRQEYAAFGVNLQGRRSETHVFQLSPGDRLRVDITSSNFPRLARNLNTGAPFAKTTEMKVARQTIHMSGDYASRLVLPVIPQ